MSDNSERQSTDGQRANAESAQSRIIDGLLQGLYESDDSTESRVQRALTRFETAAPANEVRRASVFTLRRFVSLGIAAGILCLCVGIWIATSPRSADAAIARTIRVFDMPVTRVYDVEFSLSRGGRLNEGTATLYSQSADRFLMHFDQAPNQPVMVGTNGEQTWVRLGRRTWHSDDSEELPASFAFDRLASRQVRFNQWLRALPEQFSMRWMRDAVLPGTDIRCYRLAATRRFVAPELPRSIVLWIDPDTDITRRVEVTMRRGAGPGMRDFVATYRGDEQFVETFFEAESH